MSTLGPLQNQKYQTCIDACNSCAEACEYCATCDLQEQDVKAMASCVQVNRDCANICWTASQFMSRDSEYVKQICKICEACAEECEQHTDMDHCQRCAQVCRRCAMECRKM